MVREGRKSNFRDKVVAFEQGTRRDEFELDGIADLYDVDVWYPVDGTDFCNFPYNVFALKALPRLNFGLPTLCHA